MYEKGMIGNLCEFFDHDYFFWWFPRLKSVTNEGKIFFGEIC